MRKAFITGITGQDGSYLAEFLLAKGYEVYGLVRRVALEDPSHRLRRLSGCVDRLHLESGSLESLSSLMRTLQISQPDECYHLGSQSFVSYSFADEFSTLQTNINGTHHILAAIRDIVPNCKFYFAGSSEMFGKVSETPQTETTRFHPRSAYGISKVAGFDLTRNYRESYGLHASSGIIFNHESPRRGFEFVTRKITSGLANILAGKAKEIRLGNLDSRRDWGHAADYVKAMWLMLQQSEPDDYVIASGQTHSVREFADRAFSRAGLDYRDYIAIDERFYRPAEVDLLMGNAEKARRVLGWQPTISFEQIVDEMVDNDCMAAGIDLAAHVRLSRPA